MESSANIINDQAPSGYLIQFVPDMHLLGRDIEVVPARPEMFW